MSRISELTELVEIDDADLFTVVDVSDDAMAGSGTNKRLTLASLIAALPPGEPGEQGPPGEDGNDGAPGATGPAGPNEITTATETNLTGILTGDGDNVAALAFSGVSGQYLSGVGSWVALVSAASPLTLTAASASERPLLVKGAASQTANLFESQANGSTTPLARITSAGNFSNNQGRTASEAFGEAVVINQSYENQIAFGHSITCQPGSVMIGRSLAANFGWQNNVLIGQSINVGSSFFSVVIGYNAQGAGSATAGSNSVVVGAHATTGGNTACVVLGRNSAATGNNQFVCGATSYFISDVYFGSGVTNSSPVGFTLHGTSGSGNNVAGADLRIAGGRGTGNAAAGKVTFQTSPVGSSGATLQTLVDCGQFDANASAGNTRFLLYDVDSGTLQRVKVGANDTGPGGSGRALYLDNA